MKKRNPMVINKKQAKVKTIKLYAVRQYRPAYCSGFENQAFKNVSYDDILKLEFLNVFRHDAFKDFTIEKDEHRDERHIMANYDNSESRVVGFCIPMDSKQMSNNDDLMIDNWRYKNHES